MADALQKPSAEAYGAIFRPSHRSLDLHSPNTLITCTGALVHLRDVATSSSTFLHMHEQNVLKSSGICISSTGKYIAVQQTLHALSNIQSGTPKDTGAQQVAVYNLKVGKLVRAITNDDPKPEQSVPSTVMDFCFSGGLNSHLAVIWGPEDPILVVYKWYMGKVVATVESTGCFRAAYESQTDLLAVISTTQIFLIVIVSGSAQKSLLDVPAKASYTCLAFSSGLLLVGKSDGEVLVIRNGILLAQLAAVPDRAAISHRRGSEEINATQMLTVACVVPFGSGFVSTTVAGNLAVYGLVRCGRSDTVPFELKDHHQIQLGSSSTSIVSIAASATGEHVTALSNLGEIFQLYPSICHDETEINNIIGDVLLDDRAAAPFATVCKASHCDWFSAMDAQRRGTLLVTVGNDHVVRILDAATSSSVSSFTVMDDISAVAIHPCSNLVLVATHASVLLLEATVYALYLSPFTKAQCRTVVEYPLKRVSPMVFSRSGELFAAVEGTSFTIVIMALHSGDVKCKFSGHGGLVTGLSWSEHDHTLCSVSSDGACLFWDISSQQRLRQVEYINNMRPLSAVSAMPVPGYATARSTSGQAQAIVDGDVSCEVAVPPGAGLGMELLGDGNVLVLGDAMGNLLCYPWSSCIPARDRIHKRLLTTSHSAAVISVCAAANETLLVSAAADGTVIIWDAQVIVDGYERVAPWSYFTSPQCTVTQVALEEVLQRARTLGKQVLGAESAATAKSALRIKELQENVQQQQSQILDLGKQMDKKEDEVDKQAEKLNETVRERMMNLEREHMQAIQTLEATFEKRLQLHQSEMHAQMAAKDDQQMHVEEAMKRVNQECAARVSEVEQELKTTVTEKEEKFAQLKRESDAAQAEFIEVIEQAEAEFDDNTDRLKLELQSTKEAAKEMEEDLNAQTHVYSRDNLRLKGEKLNDTRTMTKMQKRIKELEDKLLKQQNKSQDLLFRLQEQRTQATGSNTIIEEMRDQISQLQTTAFVLGDRAKKFEAEVEPGRKEVKRLTEQRTNQDKELARVVRLLNNLKQAVMSKDEQIRNLKSAALEDRNKAMESHNIVEQLKTEVSQALAASDESAPGRLSERQLALGELATKWLKPRHRSATAGEEDTDFTSVMSRRVTAVELKAGLTDLWAQRVRRSCKSAVSRKQEQATQLLRENNLLRKENKRLRDQLLNVTGKQQDEAAGQLKKAAVQSQLYASADSCPKTSGPAHNSATIDGSWDDDLSGAPGLGSRAVPSRPASAKLSQHALKQGSANKRPWSATPALASTTQTLGLRADKPTGRRRPSSAQSLGRNGRPKTAGSSRAPLLPLTDSVGSFGHATQHAVVQLQERSETQAGVIEQQHAELQLLKAMLYEKGLEGTDGNVEEDENDEEDGRASESDHSGAPALDASGHELTSTRHAGQGLPWEYPSHRKTHGKERKRRPTSAGGVGLERARQVLQFQHRQPANR